MHDLTMRYLTLLVWFVTPAIVSAQSPGGFGVNTDEIRYKSDMDSEASIDGWIMEGPGRVTFAEGWMTMESPGEEMHHVFWCPDTLPDSFVAQWEMQNQNLDAGLSSAVPLTEYRNATKTMEPSLAKRDGTFSQYNDQALQNYHISYYAHNPKLPNREVARLRKNPGKNIVSEGPRGIEGSSSKIHRITLIKQDQRIRFYVDDRLIIDWADGGEVNGHALGEGKIGLRQMQWTRFRYRNFTVWGLE